MTSVVPLRFLLALTAVALASGLACTSSPGGHLPCLDETSVQDMVKTYWANPSSHEIYVGTEECLDGIATSIEVNQDRAAVTVSVAPEVDILLEHSQAGEPEEYRKLTMWADLRREMDIIRVWCKFAGFEPVQSAPKPTVVPVYDDCRLAS